MPIDRDTWREEFFAAEALPLAASSRQKAQRGREFEAILFAMFDEADLQPRLSFRPSGEEVDGSIWLDGRTILIEAKWTEAAHPASSIYQFKGKVDGKLVGTLGLFISINGFSPDAVDALVAGKELNIILADGADVRAIAKRQVSVIDALREKLRAAGDEAAVYWPVEASVVRAAAEAAQPANTPPAEATDGRRIVVVEGRNDVRYLEAARLTLGLTTPMMFVPAGGPRNMPSLIRALSEGSDLRSIAVIVDADVEASFLDDMRKEVTPLSNAHETRFEIIAAEPDLETVLGLNEPDVPFGAREWLRRPTEGFLAQALSRENLEARAQENASLRSILRIIAGE